MQEALHHEDLNMNQANVAFGISPTLVQVHQVNVAPPHEILSQAAPIDPRDKM